MRVMRVMRKGLLSIASLIMLVVAMYNTPSIGYAKEIDLTNLATGDEISHSHIMVRDYDSDKHWTKCNLCDYTEGVQAHNITSVTTHGKSCDPSNMIIYTCSDCEYTKETNAGYAHGVSYVLLLRYIDADGNIENELSWWCSTCQLCYANSKRGYVYRYTNGEIINPDDAYFGMQVIAPGNYKTNVVSLNTVYITDEQSYHMDTDGVYTIITARYKTPELYMNKLTDYEITHPTEGGIIVTGVIKDSLGPTLLTPYDVKFDRANGVLEFKFKFIMVPDTIDKRENGTFALWWVYGFNDIEDELGTSTAYTFKIDGVEPTIELTGFEV